MKNKIFYIFFIIILVISSIITLFLYDYNQKLIKDIESKERLIKKTSSNDSILFETTKEYSKIISKYTFENEFMIGDKKVSAKELVNLFNNIFNENRRLKDSVNYFKYQTRAENESSAFYRNNYIKYLDSTNIYRFAFKSAIKDYGIQYYIKKIDSSFILQRSFSKADSALLLYPYYKDMIRKDPVSGAWIITYEKRQVVDNKKKK